MVITYHSDSTFHDGILSLVKRGVMFSANHKELTITLSGGY